MADVCNYADDTTVDAYDLDFNNLIIRLKYDASLAIEWFESNYKKLNQDRYHFLFSNEKLCKAKV